MSVVTRDLRCAANIDEYRRGYCDQGNGNYVGCAFDPTPPGVSGDPTQHEIQKVVDSFCSDTSIGAVVALFIQGGLPKFTEAILRKAGTSPDWS